MKVLLHEMNWCKAKGYFTKNDAAILPVGSDEEHGPANPLGTLSTVDETSSGIFGRGIAASVEKGKKGFEAVVSELVKHVVLLKRAKMEDLKPRPKL